jgi:hypothetical protein
MYLAFCDGVPFTGGLMMFSSLIVLLALAAPNPDTRGFAWRVIDTYDPTYECALACTSPMDEDRDTACIQEAIIKGATDERYNATELPPGDCYVNATLEVLATEGYQLYGHGPHRTSIFWESATAADPVLYIGDVRDSLFRDFEIQPAANREITHTIVVDNCDDCAFPGEVNGGSYTPSQNHFERINIGAPSGLQELHHGIVIEDHVHSGTDGATTAAGNTLTTAAGGIVGAEYTGSTLTILSGANAGDYTISGTPTSTVVTITTTFPNTLGSQSFELDPTEPLGANNDFHSFRDLRVYAYRGDAFRIEGGQHKTILFDGVTCLSDASFLETSVCVRSDGCFVWTGGGGGFNDIDFYNESQGCQTDIRSANFEGSSKWIYHGASNGTYSGLVVVGSRWASNGFSAVAAGSDRYVIDSGYSGGVVLIGNIIGEYTVQKPMAIRLQGGGANGSIMMGNGFFTTLTPAEMFPVYRPFVFEGNADYGTNSEGLPVNVITLIGGATPTVRPGLAGSGSSSLMSVNNGVTTITDLVDGFDGQVVTLWGGGSAGRTIEDNANIALSMDIDVTLANDDVLVLQQLSGVWTEIGRAASVWSGTQVNATNIVAATLTAEAPADTLTITSDAAMLLDAGAGEVEVEGQVFSDDGANAYSLSVGTASSTWNVMGNADISAPYSLIATLYGDWQVAANLLVSTIAEYTASAGVTVEGIRLENEGGNVYAFDVGTAASTLNMTANGDTSDPYSLGVNVYGDLDIFGDSATQGTITAAIVQSNGGVARLTTSGVEADDILERTAANGVEIDGTLVKDGDVHLAGAITVTAYKGIVGYVAQSNEAITGSVGTTETAYTTSTITIPANWITEGADLIVEAWFDVTGDGAATAYNARVYWGGLSGGVALNAYTGIGIALANDIKVEAVVNYATIGGTPEWNSWAVFTTVANSSYILSFGRWAQATQATNATITLQATVQYTGAPDVNDIVTLRKLSVRQAYNDEL